MIIDGGVMIDRPWEELEKIESHLGISERFFTKERFAKRSDGYYCIKKSLSEIPNISDKDLICMPSSKGRSAKVTNSLTTLNEKYLYKFYRESNLNLVPRFHRKLSWFENFNNVQSYIARKVIPKVNNRAEAMQILQEFDMVDWTNLTENFKNLADSKNAIDDELNFPAVTEPPDEYSTFSSYDFSTQTPMV